jgi:23S rRNA (guanosine2251-2'-O)-methyltransferase
VETKKIISGRNPVLEYLKSPETDSLTELYILENAHGKIIDTITAEARRKKISITYTGKGFFESFKNAGVHQGVVLKVPSGYNPQKKMGLPELLNAAAQKKGVLVLLDQLTDPHNTGSIIRTAEALGCDGIIMSDTNSAGLTPTVIKSSAGATAHIPVISVTNVARFLEEAKNAGFWIVGSSDKGTSPLIEVQKFKPAVVVIGSEGKGMRRLTGELCDAVVCIPLKGNISSLNASVAAGIILYEILK